MKDQKKKKRYWTDFAVLAGLIIIIIIGSILFNNIDLNAMSDFITSFTYLAPLVYIGMMFLAIIISPIPSIPLDILAGAIFGGFLGGLYSLIGAELGAITAFLIARKFGRKIIERFTHKEIDLCDKCFNNRLPLIVFLTRLLPVFQFDIISYAAGLTRMKLWKFALATLLGMAPIVFLLSYTGKNIFMGNIWINLILTFVIILFMYQLPKHLMKHVKMNKTKNNDKSPKKKSSLKKGTKK